MKQKQILFAALGLAFFGSIGTAHAYEYKCAYMQCTYNSNGAQVGCYQFSAQFAATSKDGAADKLNGLVQTEINAYQGYNWVGVSNAYNVSCNLMQPPLQSACATEAIQDVTNAVGAKKIGATVKTITQGKEYSVSFPYFGGTYSYDVTFPDGCQSKGLVTATNVSTDAVAATANVVQTQVAQTLSGSAPAQAATTSQSTQAQQKIWRFQQGTLGYDVLKDIGVKPSTSTAGR